jgi:hypothetical protein
MTPVDRPDAARPPLTKSNRRPRSGKSAKADAAGQTVQATPQLRGSGAEQRAARQRQGHIMLDDCDVASVALAFRKPRSGCHARPSKRHGPARPTSCNGSLGFRRPADE